jgi:2C-methyl-D-erythritol 2,4-cyclodiphosphate synthase
MKLIDEEMRQKMSVILGCDCQQINVANESQKAIKTA